MANEAANLDAATAKLLDSIALMIVSSGSDQLKLAAVVKMLREEAEDFRTRATVTEVAPLADETDNTAVDLTPPKTTTKKAKS